MMALRLNLFRHCVREVLIHPDVYLMKLLNLCMKSLMQETGRCGHSLTEKELPQEQP